jgi:hypothetical protein
MSGLDWGGAVADIKVNVILLIGFYFFFTMSQSRYMLFYLLVFTFFLL